METSERRLRELWEHREIELVILRLARATDRRPFGPGSPLGRPDRSDPSHSV